MATDRRDRLFARILTGLACRVLERYRTLYLPSGAYTVLGTLDVSQFPEGLRIRGAGVKRTMPGRPADGR